MTEPSSSTLYLELDDVMAQLAINDAGEQRDNANPQASQPGSQNSSADLAAGYVAGDTAVEPLPRIAQLESELAATKTTLSELERSLQKEQRRVLELQQQLAAAEAKGAAKAAAANPFDMMLTLSSEREAALRERKLYKDRAAKAEDSVAQLESALAAANATAKLQTERANKLAAGHEELQQRIAELEMQLSAQHTAVDSSKTVTALQQRLQERDNRIRELEAQLTDHAGTPTLFSGELERHAPGAIPTVTYALASLDTPGEVHKLTHPVHTVGRSKANDIALDSPSISRFHARLLNKPDGVWLIDLQSSNGCHVNDQRISNQALSEGDLVVIGTYRFRFAAVTPSQAAAIAI